MSAQQMIKRFIKTQIWISFTIGAYNYVIWATDQAAIYVCLRQTVSGSLLTNNDI